MTSLPFAVPGMDADALDRELELVRGERLASRSRRGPSRRTCTRSRRRTPSRSKWSVPLPTSSSTVKAIRAVARGASSWTSWRDGGHDRGHAGLVVRAEQRRPVARDEVLPELLGEGGHLRRVEDLRRIARKADRLARPGAMDDRADARPRRVGGRVDVCDQPDRRRLGRPSRGASRRRSPARSARHPRDRARGARRPGAGRGRAASRSTGRSASRRSDWVSIDDVAEEALEQLLAERLGERARVARVSQAPRAGAAARPSSSARRAARRRGCARSASGAAPSGA